jgi:hypothetical protein
LSTRVSALDIDFLTTSEVIDTLGYLHVFGEAQNNGSQNLKYVEIVGTFYNAGHAVIETEYTFTLLDQLEPTQKSPFDLFIMNVNTSAEVTEYKLTATSSEANAKPHGLQILSHSNSIDNLGYLEIVGEIKNLQNNSASYVEVIGTFYDQNGTVVGCDYTFTDPTDLAGGQTGPFKITFMYQTLSGLVSSYTLTAQSNEYSIIPEFPLGPVFMLLITSLFLVILARRFRLCG